jgi:hypothetical protein
MRTKLFTGLAASVIAVAFGLMPYGCTIAPKPVQATVPSFDGTAQTSGFLVWTNGYVVVTLDAIARYNALIGRYGTNLKKPQTPRLGVVYQLGTNAAWLSGQASVDFGQMELWKRSGK